MYDRPHNMITIICITCTLCTPLGDTHCDIYLQQSIAKRIKGNYYLSPVHLFMQYEKIILLIWHRIKGDLKPNVIRAQTIHVFRIAWKQTGETILSIRRHALLNSSKFVQERINKVFFFFFVRLSLKFTCNYF